MLIPGLAAAAVILTAILTAKIKNRKFKERTDSQKKKKQEEEKARRATMRRGVIQYKINWRDKVNNKWEDKEAFVTAVVREVDRVAGQSQIEFICVDDAPCNWSREYAKRKLGQWVATKDVDWDSQAEDGALEKLKVKLQEKKDPTPEQLLQAVLQDDLENL